MPPDRSIAVVTGSRADFGLLQPVLDAILETPGLALRLMVCGMHLSPAYGNTVGRIEAAGYPIAERIDSLDLSDGPAGIASSIARGIAGFSRAFERSRPDLLLLLGDRYEMLAAATGALPFALPIAHIHGGELTEGLIDEAIRHSLSKMSHLHFVSTVVYRRRLIQMGEQPDRVFVTGAPGLDAIQRLQPTAAGDLARRHGMVIDPAPLLVTFHPVTLEIGDLERQVSAVMQALDGSGRPVLFTYPNADTSASAIVAAIESFVAGHADARLVKNLGSADYFGVMGMAAAMVGNSSSGILEAASFHLPVVNIGDRQRGRLRPANVIDCAAEAGAITAAIAKATSGQFREHIRDLANPYGDGHAAERIVKVLKSADIDGSLVKKRFFDLPFPQADL